ncbi:hypothetical protein GJ496_005824 [Pomphorhynchus laevis]|nr:hypothetical protein GJ496_005824 [Pomphorhynchus laevis]
MLDNDKYQFLKEYNERAIVSPTPSLFERTRNAVANAMPSLPNQQAENASGFCNLRIISSLLCMAASILLYLLAFLYFPVIALKATKFVTLFTLANISFLASLGIFLGFTNFVKQCFHGNNSIASIAYILTTSLTLFASISLRSKVLSVICVFLQIATIVWIVWKTIFNTSLNLVPTSLLLRFQQII